MASVHKIVKISDSGYGLLDPVRRVLSAAADELTSARKITGTPQLEIRPRYEGSSYYTVRLTFRMEESD